MTSSQLPGERFRRHRFGWGYDVEAVDTFLAQAELGAFTATEITDIAFRSVRWGGYDEKQVDEALDVLVDLRTADGRVGSAAPKPPSWLSRRLGK